MVIGWPVSGSSPIAGPVPSPESFSFGIEPSTTSTNGSISPRSARHHHSMNSGAVLVGEHRVVDDHLRHPRDRLEDDVLQARVDRGGHRDGVAVAGESRGHPDDVGLDGLGLLLVRYELSGQRHQHSPLLRCSISSHQQILGSGSPASRSITRRPPKAVSTRTIPGGSAVTSPISTAASQPGTARRAARASSAAGRARRKRPSRPRSPRTSGRSRAARMRPRPPG